MKRYIAILLALLMVLACLAGCHKSSDSDETTTATTAASDSKSSDTETTTAKSASKKTSGTKYVTVTFPASFYEGYEESDIKSASEESGYKSCTINKDGSVTYEMTEAQLQELKDEMKDTVDDTITSITTGDNSTGTISSVKYNKNMSKFNIYVDGDAYSEMTTLNAMLFYTSGAYYQVLNGVDEDDIEIEVNFLDKDSGKVLDTEYYSDYLEMYSNS